ncbi:MAG TPA: HEAT repeat domain-containing protein [Pyrinomonadaceae bacterium]|nr:HEAT repeat domain-containing protein [Pyrinomonadaceae bacterium]
MKDLNPKRFGRDAGAATSYVRKHKVALATAVLVFLTTMAGTPGIDTQAQRLYAPVKVSNVTSQSSANRSLVTISADGALARAQTWQDEEGFHLVLPNTVAVESIKPARGVKLRRIGSSLEVLAQTKPGSKVNLSSTNNQVTLAIDGKLEARPTESGFRVSSNSSDDQILEDQRNHSSQNIPAPPQSSISTESTTVTPATDVPSTQTTAITQAAPTSVEAPASTSQSQVVAQGDGTVPPPPIRVNAEDPSMLSSIFSGTSVFIVFALGLIGLLVSRKVRSKQNAVSKSPEDSAKWDEVSENVQLERTPQNGTASKSLVKRDDTVATKTSQKAMARVPAGPSSLYGAYRIDQEVGKLTLGQPHRIDVLASRAIDDRRAIEASLIKAVNSTTLDESAQRRAREALEEYGFVARQCAALLLAPDSYERSSAAKALGEIKSPAALPFLLEGLYDSESIVRNQSVMSIGELKLPSAIGALLDIARTHPDVPSSLLSKTLSACSVEGLDFFDAVVTDTSLLGPGDIGHVIQDISHLESSMPIDSLPESSDDEAFLEALVSVDSPDVEKRAEALKTLVQFRVQSAVDAISRVARHDPEGTIRSLAISSLGSISHESVFATVLIGMADESREVRAAAARSVSRLNFDRADAYVRVMETSDEETLRSVAQACIQAGIVSQNLDRLKNADHRQAYETFALICLLTQAKLNGPVLEAIATHPRMDVRLKAVHLLGCTGHPDVPAQLRQLAVNDDMGEVVKTALLEALYKLDQNYVPKDEVFNEFEIERNSDCVLETGEASENLTPDFEMPPAYDVEVHSEADEFER